MCVHACVCPHECPYVPKNMCESQRIAWSNWVFSSTICVSPWGSNSDRQAWWQVPLPMPFCWPFYSFFMCLFVWPRVLLCSFGWLETRYVEQASVKLIEPPASAFRVLVLKAWATTFGALYNFWVLEKILFHMRMFFCKGFLKNHYTSIQFVRRPNQLPLSDISLTFHKFSQFFLLINACFSFSPSSSSLSPPSVKVQITSGEDVLFLLEPAQPWWGN